MTNLKMHRFLALHFLPVHTWSQTQIWCTLRFYFFSQETSKVKDKSISVKNMLYIKMQVQNNTKRKFLKAFKFAVLKLSRANPPFKASSFTPLFMFRSEFIEHLSRLPESLIQSFVYYTSVHVQVRIPFKCFLDLLQILHPKPYLHPCLCSRPNFLYMLF